MSAVTTVFDAFDECDRLRHENKLLRLSLLEETQTRLRMEEAVANESLKRIAAEQSYMKLLAQTTEDQ